MTVLTMLRFTLPLTGSLLVLLGFVVVVSYLRDRGTTPPVEKQPPISATNPQPQQPIVEAEKNLEPPAPPPEPTAEAVPGEAKSPADEAKLFELIEDYNQAVADLQSEVADYRASVPAYGDFVEKLADFVQPLALEGERARLQVREQVEVEVKKDPNFKLDYDSKLADRVIHEILASMYKDIAADVEELIRSGKIELSVEEARRIQEFLARTREFAKPGGEHQEYPYDAGTLEHLEFIRNFSYAAQQYSGALMALVFKKLPPELEQAKSEVDTLYEQIAKEAAGADKSPPSKYVDPDFDLLEKMHKTSQQILQLESELESLRAALREQATAQGR